MTMFLLASVLLHSFNLSHHSQEAFPSWWQFVLSFCKFLSRFFFFFLVVVVVSFICFLAYTYIYMQIYMVFVFLLLNYSIYHDHLVPSTLLQMVRFHLFYGWITFHCRYVPHLYHLAIDKRLAYFHILAIVSNTAVNREVHISFQVSVMDFFK